MAEPSNKLTTHTPIPLPSIAVSMQMVAKHHGVSGWRQLIDIVKLRFGPGKISPHEYYQQRLYRASLSRADKRCYQGASQSYKLIAATTAPEHFGSRSILDDKPVFLALCEASDIPVTHTQGRFSLIRQIGQWAHLDSADAIADFLLKSAKYPLFGKPDAGRQSYGCVQIERLTDDGHLVFVGEEIGPHVNALAAEIEQKFPGGYLFQTCLETAVPLRALTPDAIGPLRIMTIYDKQDEPSALLGLMRSPLSGTYAGPGKGKQIVMSTVDLQNAVLMKSKLYEGGKTQHITTHPITGIDLDGFSLPQLPDAIKLALRSHKMLPMIGVIGWDIAMTDHGPVIIEGNSNPAVGKYQAVDERGILNPDFAPKIAAAQARAAAQSATLQAITNARQKGTIRELVALERSKFKS